jgi:phage terminase large subunit GpA-like protein
MIQAKTLDLFRRIFRKSLAPIPRTTVSEWADNYRVLSSESAAEPGRWRTDRAPYQRPIMDSFTTVGIHKVVVKSASQIGKSDIMNNVIGRFSHLDPGPIMMIQPTIDLAEDYSKSRISPMIRDSKALTRLFFDVKSRDTNNTILSKLFPGGRLIMCGANSPAGLASRPIRVLLGDEVDRFPASAGTEGDPVDLAAKRLTTFWNWVMGLFSTPTDKGASRIETEYISGTQEEWQHQCPNCEEYHLVTHRDMLWNHQESIRPDGTKFVMVEWVKWRCPDCGLEFEEQEMKNSSQKYVVQNPDALQNGIRSFFINGFASPWLKWKAIIREYLEAKGDPDREKVVFNTRFGETYERRGEIEDETAFVNRRERYDVDLPDGVLLLTAAVDTQDNRLEYEVCGWGEGEECWGIKKGVVLGVPDSPQVWAELDQHLERLYYFNNGIGLRVARTFIDSGGHYAKEVYQYCFANMRKQRFAIKGMGGSGIPLVHMIGKAKGYGIPLIMLGVDSGKQHVLDRLLIEKPGSKYFHFPIDDSRGYDQIYFKGLIAEKLVRRRAKGVTVLVWENISTDGRNEPLDLRVYNLACLQSINPNWAAYKEAVLGIKALEKPAKETKKQYGCVKKGMGG